MRRIASPGARYHMYKWYIWRSPRPDGAPFEWLLQFPLNRRRTWWNESTNPVVVTAFDSYADAVAYMQRVESHRGVYA